MNSPVAGVVTQNAVVRGRPDRHAAALTSAIIEICREPGASARATLVQRKSRVFNGKGCLPFPEPDEFVASGEDVRREQGDVFERPRSSGAITSSGMRGVRFSPAMKR